MATTQEIALYIALAREIIELGAKMMERLQDESEPTEEEQRQQVDDIRAIYARIRAISDEA